MSTIKLLQCSFGYPCSRILFESRVALRIKHAYEVWVRHIVYAARKRRYKRAKLVDLYYFSGTENLWYGNWNRHICHKWNYMYEVDSPYRSTEVNLGMKQKCCFLSCLWSQVQQDTSGPCNSQTLSFIEKILSMYLYVKLNRDANCFLPVESKICLNSASYE